MCVKKGLFFGCSCLVKKAFRLVQISVPALRIAVICVVLTLISPPLQGAAANAFAESFEPLYLKQLESYNREVEQYLQKEYLLKIELIFRLALRSHVFRRGETLSMIAGLYGVDVESLAYWNELANPNLIFPEQVLDVLSIEGTLYRVKKGDSIEVIARRLYV